MNLNVSVGEMVAERPGRARIFEQIGIDYCCGGKVAFGEACASLGLDPQTVAAKLSDAETAAGNGALDPAAMSLSELIQNIVDTHHAFLRRELPRLDQLLEKTIKAHSEKDARLAHLREVFHDFRDEIFLHMMKEEQILFPMIRNLESSGSSTPIHCGSITNPIRVMESEHQSAGDALAMMRAFTDGFVAPESACNTWRALCSGLADLERDTHEHIHKENNILFPRALFLSDVSE